MPKPKKQTVRVEVKPQPDALNGDMGRPDREKSAIMAQAHCLLAAKNRIEYEKTSAQNNGGVKKNGEAQNRATPRYTTPALMELSKQRIEILKQQKELVLSDIKKFVREVPEGKLLTSLIPGLAEGTICALLAYVDIHSASTVSSLWHFGGMCPKEVPLHRKHPDTGEWYATTTLGRADQLHPGFKSSSVRVLRKELFTASESIMKHGISAVPCSQEEWDGLHPVYQTTKKIKEDGEDGKKVEVEYLARSTPKNVWGKMYLDYKYRKFHDERMVPHTYNKKQGPVMMAWKDVPDSRRHAAALRYIIKQALVPIHKAWREFHGLAVRPPYSEEKLGHVHGA